MPRHRQTRPPPGRGEPAAVCAVGVHLCVLPADRRVAAAASVWNNWGAASRVVGLMHRPDCGRRGGERLAGSRHLRTSTVASSWSMHCGLCISHLQCIAIFASRISSRLPSVFLSASHSRTQPYRVRCDDFPFRALPCRLPTPTYTVGTLLAAHQLAPASPSVARSHPSSQRRRCCCRCPSAEQSPAAASTTTQTTYNIPGDDIG